MPARETEAIILKTFPLGEADRLVSFLGRTSGRIRGVAGGARRLKNRYGSTLEILSHVQIWYVEKETRDLVRIQQCELIESFNKAQSDYEPQHRPGRRQRDLRAGFAGARSRRADVPAHSAGRLARSNGPADWVLPLSYFALLDRAARWLASAV